jgi:predicted nucleotidyltransferase/DNA-binding transcriptional regulator YiaG
MLLIAYDFKVIICPMASSQSDRIAALPAEQPAAIEPRAEGLIAQELSLRELRKALGLTQTELARRLNKGQEVVSRIEQRQDLLLSTLRSYLRSLGGELELVCRLTDRAKVRIKSAGHQRSQAGPAGPAGARQGAPSLIAQHRSEIAALCHRYGVRRLAVFGSILGQDFDAESSDIDIVVGFRTDVGPSPAHQYFDFKAALEQLLGRPVDLVELDAMADSRLKRIIECTQVVVYVEAA